MRQLNMEQHRHRVRGGVYLKDIVFSANDGIITTFAVVAGVAGAEFGGGVVIALGLANLFADGLSMAIGNYLGVKSQVELEQTETLGEAEEVTKKPDEEREEMVEIASRRGVPESRIPEWVSIMTSRRKLWVDELAVWELGILPKRPDSPLKHSLVTFSAFVIAGFFPLVTYIFPWEDDRFLPSIFVTAAALFTVGSMRTLVTKRNWLRSGLEMLIVGGTAALAAYLVGRLVRRII